MPVKINLDTYFAGAKSVKITAVETTKETAARLFSDMLRVVVDDIKISNVDIEIADGDVYVSMPADLTETHTDILCSNNLLTEDDYVDKFELGRVFDINWEFVYAEEDRIIFAVKEEQ